MKEKKKLLSEQERVKRIFEICEALDGMSFEERVKICHHLNGWRWIDILPGKPDGWENMTQDEQFLWTEPICSYIESGVGQKALLRYYHKTECGKTDQEFEDWWESCSRYSAHDVINQCQNQRHCGNTERYESGNTQEFVVPFFLGANIGIFLVALLTYILKICGVL